MDLVSEFKERVETELPPLLADMIERQWPKFQEWEAKAAKQGSGMTREQLTGALMYHLWLKERMGRPL